MVNGEMIFLNISVIRYSDFRFIYFCIFVMFFVDMETSLKSNIAVIDEERLKNLFNKFFQALCVFASSYVEDDALAADIVQESYLSLWFHRGELRHEKSVKSFLYTMVRNNCLNSLKKEKSRKRGMAYMESDFFWENTLIRVESYRMLYNAIEELPHQTREIINLALDGLKNEEIAERLGVSINTVHTLKKVAYKKLKVALKDHYYLLFFLFS